MVKGANTGAGSAAPNDFAVQRSASFWGAAWRDVRRVLIQVLLIGVIAYLTLSTVGAAYQWLAPSTTILHDVLIWFGFLALAMMALFAGGTVMLIVLAAMNYQTIKRVLK